MSIEFTQPGYIYVWKQTPEGDIYVSRHRSQDEADESVFRSVEANGDGDYRIETPDRFVKVKYVVFKRPATEPPTPPTGLVILSLDAGTAVLDWNNNPEPNVTAYRVYYSQNGISFELYSSPSTSTATVTGLAPAITHFFKVAAYNSAGQESAFSDTVSGADTVPPAIPTGLLIVPGSITGNQLALDWNNNTDTDFAYYRVYQSTNQSTWTNISGDITSSVHVATGLISETTYYFRVAATDSSGNESAPTSSVSGTTLDITAPANATNFAILESSTTASTMFMTWTASVSSDIAGYKIYRSTDGTNYTLVATLGLVTNYEDTGLTANTLYYYKISAIDEVPNESALSTADSYTTLTSGLTWINDSVPFPLSISAGSYFDLEPYITDIAQLGNIESIGTALPSGVTIESTPTWRLSATSGATLGTTSGHQLRLVRSVDSDWQSRISGSGVIWYHNFESVNEVNRFRWTNGFSGGSDPNDASSRAGTVAWDSTGGVGGGGCLLITRRTNAESSDWWRMFSPLDGASNGRGVDDPAAGGTIPLRTFSPTSGGSQFSDWTGGYIGHPNYANAEPTNFISSPGFYLQMRVKMDPRRTIAGNTQVGKLLFHTITRVSNVNQEIVTYSGSFPVSGSGQPNYFRMYGGNGTANPIEDQEPRPGQQPNSDLANYAAGQYCDVSNAALRGYCWSWSGGWDTIMYYIRPGREGVSGDAFIQVYAAHEGETSYTKIWEQTFTNVYSSVVDQYRRYGYNAIQASVYQNGAAQASEFWHKYAQIILSTQFIPCPQV